MFVEGDEADCVYVVRTSSVVIESPRWPARAVNVVGPLGLFGEVAILRDGRRTATARADDECELVAIPAGEIRDLIARGGEFAARMQERAGDLAEEKFWKDEDVAARNESLSARFRRGGIVPRATRLVDPSICIRCRMCEEACADTHGGVPRLTIDEPVVAGVRDSSACSNCETAFCEMACGYAAITRGMDGQVEIHADRCVGCKACVMPGTGCPYGSIQIVPFASLRRGGRPSALRSVRRSLMRAYFGIPWVRRVAGAASSSEEEDAAPVRTTRVGVHGRAIDPTCDKKPSEPPRAVAVKCDLCRSVGGVERCVASCPVDAIRIEEMPRG